MLVVTSLLVLSSVTHGARPVRKPESMHRNELVLKSHVEEVIKTAQPHTYLNTSDLPDSLDYRKMGLLTSDLNQHIPVYCGSCWAHAAFSSIADRIKIGQNGTERDIIPSIQALINCGDAGSCNGGDSNAANSCVYRHGIPDVTCQQYQAKNMECSDINTCMNCDPDPDIGCYGMLYYSIFVHKGDSCLTSSLHSILFNDSFVCLQLWSRTTTLTLPCTSMDL